jgi:hypothetical protein
MILVDRLDYDLVILSGFAFSFLYIWLLKDKILRMEKLHKKSWVISEINEYAEVTSSPI